MRKDDANLLDIVQAAGKALAYVESVDRAAFEANEMLQDAVMLQLVVIGEAVGRLSEAFRDLHPELPWKKIRATRNIVAHAYQDVDLAKIWTAVHEGLPRVLEVLSPLIPADDPPSNDADAPPEIRRAEDG